MDTPIEKPIRKPRGFAAMSPEKVREIAAKGGKAAHVAGTAHRFTADEAKAAGIKGGKAPHVRRGKAPKAKPKDDTELVQGYLDRKEEIPAGEYVIGGTLTGKP